MRTGRVWRVVAWRLTRLLPPHSAASTLGDLHHDYLQRLREGGRLRAAVWLLRESGSLVRAYRADRTRRSFNTRGLTVDTLHAWRRLNARRGSALLCAALLAMGIGVSTTMFSVVDALVLSPAPFPFADRVVRHGLPPSPQVAHVVQGWLASGVVDAVETAAPLGPLALNADAPGTNGSYAAVTPGMFEMLGVAPSRGRTFDDNERSEQPDVIVLSESLWRARFEADPALIGRRIEVAGRSLTVIGIMPAAFRFPSPDTVAWVPLDLRFQPVANHWLHGRLRTGVPFADADAQLRGISFRIYPMPNRREAAPVTPLAANSLDALTQQGLWLLLAGAVLVFVVLCANVSSLLLTALAARRKEFGMCAALGASRTRLLRQAAIEHGILAVFGAAGGVAVAITLTSAVPALFLGRTLNLIDIDLRAGLAACLLGGAAVIVCGLIPAWLGTRANASDALRGTRAGGQAPAAGRATQGLLVTEFALACALLIGSVVLVRSFVNLATADRGIALGGVVQVAVHEIDTAFPLPAVNALGTAAIEDEVRRWPEVATHALSRDLPPASSTARVDPGGQGEPGEWLQVDQYRIHPDYFALYRVPLVQGQSLSKQGQGEVVISQRVAKTLWPGGDPIGQTMIVGRRDRRRVVGVAGEVRLPTLEEDIDRPEIYLPLDWTARTLYLSLRCSGPCPTGEVMEQRLRRVHPVLEARVRPPADAAFTRELQLPKAIAQIAAVFGAVSVLTAAGGLFSLLTAAVGRRRREFGIRAALGVSPSQLRLLVLHEGARLVMVGVTVGAIGGIGLSQWLDSIQYGVTIADPWAWATVLGLLTLTALAATWRPGRQAVRINPIVLLKED
jgi:putative ABC transport system permease protein